MTRRERERAILDIVEGRPVHTQADLVEALHELGSDVTQATVSRDIKRIGLVKLFDREGVSRYAPPQTAATPPPAAEENLRSAFREFVTGLDQGETFFLIKTMSGRANAVGIAIDEARVPGVSGTIAGDDTILVAVRKAQDRPKVLRAFRELLA